MLSKKENIIREVFKIIPLSSLYTNDKQPRKFFREEAMEELKSSLKEYGILVPLLVEEGIEGYRIISGERRYQAAKSLNFKEVPVLIKKVSSLESSEISLIENIQRENLTVWEEACSYREIIKQYNLTQDDLAKSLGKNRSSITNLLRILSLPEDIQESIHKSMISLGHAKLLLTLKEDIFLQHKLYLEVLEKKLSVRELEVRIKNLNKVILKKEKDFNLDRWEHKILHILGSHVNIKGSSQKGKLVISYSSQREFEKICSFFENKEDN